MVTLVCIGLALIILEAAINVVELRRFFKGLGVLNNHTTTMKDRILYPFRLVCLAPLLGPVLPDVIFIGLGGTVGLSKGVTGGIIAMGGTCAATMLIKLALWMGKSQASGMDYDEELRNAIRRHS